MRVTTWFTLEVLFGELLRKSVAVALLSFTKAKFRRRTSHEPNRVQLTKN